MSHTLATSYTAFPVTPAAPNPFSPLGQSPRDNHAMYEDLRLVTHSFSRQSHERQRTTSGSSIKSGLKKFSGL